MKLSEQTVSLLKNFSGINQNIQFKAGNRIQTISAQKNILVSAEVPESFPSDFAIYDLNKTAWCDVFVSRSRFGNWR